MDGYHLHSSVLEGKTDSQGMPLKKLKVPAGVQHFTLTFIFFSFYLLTLTYKGHTYTFDCCAFIRDLKRLRSGNTIDSDGE